MDRSTHCCPLPNSFDHFDDRLFKTQTILLPPSSTHRVNENEFSDGVNIVFVLYSHSECGI